jgi:hypothetical protein
MSKIKSPQDKKRNSLAKDRRNVYGECPTSSRKNIRRGKQRSHRELRRAASQVFLNVKGTAESLDIDNAESRAKTKILAAQRGSFKKHPDAPLGVVIERKKVWRSKGRSGIRPTPNV